MSYLRVHELSIGPMRRLIVVEAVEQWQKTTGSGSAIFAHLRPVAAIACDPEETVAFDMNGMPLNMDCLMQAVPALNALIGPAAIAE